LSLYKVMTRLLIQNDDTCLLLEPDPELDPELDPENSCRYCLEEVAEPIKYCNCKGSQGYIHHECLVKWYEQKNYNIIKCEICDSEFNIRVIKNTKHSLLNILFFFLLTVLIFIINITIWLILPIFLNNSITDTHEYNSTKFSIFIYSIILYGIFVKCYNTKTQYTLTYISSG